MKNKMKTKTIIHFYFLFHFCVHFHFHFRFCISISFLLSFSLLFSFLSLLSFSFSFLFCFFFFYFLVFIFIFDYGTSRPPYRSRWHRLSDCYKKFEIDPVKCHSMDPEGRMKHAERFWRYSLTLDDQSDKPKSRSSSRKPSDEKRTRKQDFESAFDRLDKKKKESRKSFTFQDPNAHEPFFRSVVPRSINGCQGNCRNKLYLAGKEDYLVVKSRGCLIQRRINKEK